MFKRTTLLALALGVMAAIVMPAAASAAWKHHQVAIQQNVQINFTGNVRFDTGNGSAECQFKMNVQFLAGQTTGNLNTLAPHPTSDTANCKGLGGYAFCQAHNFTLQEMPWTFHTAQAETTTITVDGPNPGEVTVKGTGVFHQGFVITTRSIKAQATGAFCPGKEIHFTAGTLTALANQPNTFSSVQLNGGLLTHKLTNTGVTDTEVVKVTGLLEIENPEQRNTYSL